MKHTYILFLLLLCSFAKTGFSQQSVARQWNEALLQSIREDFARPPVHARNLYQVSMAMYDAWAVYDSVARPFLLGHTIGGFTCPFEGIAKPADIAAARQKAISFAAYRVLSQRFLYSPKAYEAFMRFAGLMLSLGYDYNFSGTDYQSGDPAALGNYIGQQVLQFGLQDGSNEQWGYINLYYQPVNPPLIMANPGDPSLIDPNRWQPLTLANAVDQSGNPIPATQTFQSPEWGNVQPFAMTEDDRKTYFRNGYSYNVYHDPGPLPFLDTINGGGTSDEYKWNFELVAAWASHLDPNDGVMWDISPASIGNVQSYPKTLAELHDFYDFENGSDPGLGRPVNPRTGKPYVPQIVPRGDYTRVLAQFWADGPTSETPPGHWFTILNKVNDDPNLVKKFNGKGPLLDDLEWDIKAYFTLGGAVHDAAISAWGIKGWYDGVRPVSALRYMSDLGQSSDPSLPRYHPAGIKLVPGLIEMVQAGDPLAGSNNENVGKIKFKSWRGPDYITDPTQQIGGVDWILAERWWPYQRKTFVTPPFGGYISGHSTYSRSAAEVLTNITGDEYFPGGLGEFHVAANSNFLVLEAGPSVDVTLQWATYRDASDQTSLSRIWGGIHPPFDDIPGRLIGMEVGTDAFKLARSYFYPDEDQDGHFAYEDCDDHNPAIYDGAPELCDGLDNDCNGLVDDGPVYTYFQDADGDGFGNAATALDTCLSQAPAGYVAFGTDCDDQNQTVYPGAPELCDNLDNDCNGLVNDNITFTYYADADGDGYGDGNTTLDTCLSQAPAGYATAGTDCDDQNPAIHPGADELCDGLDNDCNGAADDMPFFTYFADADGDGFGDSAAALDTCLVNAPLGFVDNGFDCDDHNPAVNPDAPEICDSLDNDCNGLADDGLLTYIYYQDADGDGFGNPSNETASCLETPPAGYASNENDCDDTNALINPLAMEVIDSLDNDCNGLIDDVVATSELFRQTKVYPNPTSGLLTIYHNAGDALLMTLTNSAGVVLRHERLTFEQPAVTFDLKDEASGIYILQLKSPGTGESRYLKVVKTN